MAICHQSPFKLFTAIPSQSSKPKPLHLRCNFSLPSRPPLTFAEPEPIFTSVKAFAPATVANLGPGFDFLGCAIDGLGDFVSLTIDPQVSPGEISISEISGDHNSKKLSRNPPFPRTVLKEKETERRKREGEMKIEMVRERKREREMKIERRKGQKKQKEGKRKGNRWCVAPSGFWKKII